MAPIRSRLLKFPSPPVNLLDSVVESCSGAVLILDDHGQALHTNQQARKICQKMLDQTPGTFDSVARRDQVPEAVWATCRPLSEEPDLFPGYAIILESEVLLPETRSVRIQAQRLDSDRAPYFLVRLEEYCPL
jgi:hypothetical protein